MAQETDWFAPKPGEAVHERCYRRRLVFAIFFGLAAALILVPMLTGCASTEREQRVCYMRMLGSTQDGWSVVASQCITPEAFMESQK